MDRGCGAAPGWPACTSAAGPAAWPAPGHAAACAAAAAAAAAPCVDAHGARAYLGPCAAQGPPAPRLSAPSALAAAAGGGGGGAAAAALTNPAAAAAAPARAGAATLQGWAGRYHPAAAPARCESLAAPTLGAKPGRALPG